jgi:hypothetical protein
VTGYAIPDDRGAYGQFLARRAQLDEAAGFEPQWLPDCLFDFQRYLARWAVRQGRGAMLADCGLGKTLVELTWAQNVYWHTGKPVLLLAPPAVGTQITAEAAKFGLEAAVSRTGRPAGPVTVTNYERLHLFDQHDFGGVACDESSVIKDFDGARRGQITDFLRKMPYRLLATATAAPNDHTELGTSSEALGYLGHMDMLGRFFTNRKSNSGDLGGRWRPAHGEEWRFKGHAEGPFWRWVGSWARAARRPSDLGFSDDGFDLPPIEYRRHIVESPLALEGTLFDVPAAGLHEERAEARRTIAERCEKAAALLDDAAPGVAWCHLNAEADLLAALIDGAVQVSGADDPDEKEAKLAAFTRGEIRVLVTKPRLGAWGLNWQHCHRMTYFPDYSFEAFYQAVRRCWRFGQSSPVTVDLITAPGGMNALTAIERKAARADRMFDALTASMRDALEIRRDTVYDRDVEVPAWARS